MLTTPPKKKKPRGKAPKEPSREDKPVIESEADFDRVLGGVLAVPVERKREKKR
jgi:hypothetical protein